MFVVTAALGLFISNTATAVLMAPLALADELQACSYPFAMTFPARCVVRLHDPVSSPVNTPVVGPGDYTFFDFVRVGVPFS